ncbi:hypothetical protein Mal15_50330 [Stieleria maiorica]|uniref:Secreted protein n=1 Tax=Stieleria maiorica TaxID=2795974 RepID=A0A5B9MLV0_9BACT|nr:hypothetical protein [Stieleria maiorica]QEG00957.1 hypothetical protein Mal15_50330 [Stieleria maiorica]
MKKLLILTALLGISVPSFVGCGGSAPTVVEPVEEDDGAMSASQQAEYEKQMREQMSKKGGN